MDVNGNFNVHGNNYSINDYTTVTTTYIVPSTSTAHPINNVVSAEDSGRYANHHDHPLRMENIWQDHQRLQMQEQVNTWNRMMYRFWKLQQQQHLIPYYRNASRSKEPLKIKKSKRKRFSYTEEQVRIMEKAFQISSFLSDEDRQYLANQLGITERNVTYWFQNRRMRTISDSQLDTWCSNFRNQLSAKMKWMPSAIMRS